jgi:hypothetical protein
MNPKPKSNHRLPLELLAMVLGLGAVASAQATSLAMKEDAAQLHSDQAGLQRVESRLIADKAWLVADSVRGRMSAESADAMHVYHDQKAINGERKDIAMDTPGSLQMKIDERMLHRDQESLETADHRLAADRREGRLAAESPDALKVYRDQQAIKAFERQIAADNATMKLDRQG